jgi:hypothetical protein
MPRPVAPHANVVVLQREAAAGNLLDKKLIIWFQ